MHAARPAARPCSRRRGAPTHARPGADLAPQGKDGASGGAFFAFAFRVWVPCSLASRPAENHRAAGSVQASYFQGFLSTPSSGVEDCLLSVLRQGFLSPALSFPNQHPSPRMLPICAPAPRAAGDPPRSHTVVVAVVFCRPSAEHSRGRGSAGQSAVQVLLQQNMSKCRAFQNNSPL